MSRGKPEPRQFHYQVDPSELGWVPLKGRTWLTDEGKYFTFAPGVPQVLVRPRIEPAEIMRGPSAWRGK